MHRVGRVEEFNHHGRFLLNIADFGINGMRSSASLAILSNGGHSVWKVRAVDTIEGALDRSENHLWERTCGPWFLDGRATTCRQFHCSGGGSRETEMWWSIRPEDPPRTASGDTASTWPENDSDEMNCSVKRASVWQDEWRCVDHWASESHVLGETFLLCVGIPTFGEQASCKNTTRDQARRPGFIIRRGPETPVLPWLRPHRIRFGFFPWLCLEDLQNHNLALAGPASDVPLHHAAYFPALKGYSKDARFPRCPFQVRGLVVDIQKNREFHWQLGFKARNTDSKDYFSIRSLIKIQTRDIALLLITLGLSNRVEESPANKRNSLLTPQEASGPTLGDSFTGFKPQKAAFRITTDSAKWPRNEPKKLFFSGNGIRGPTQKWGSGAPHKFFGSTCGGWGSPLERSVGKPTSTFCKKWAAPPKMWAAPLAVGKTVKLGTTRVI
ncbi:hypothetical protein DFH08DRAFT_822351 [Mycena albidolilacea]|uniref:Uncharacterized protein n=1 Tax=Mycena albidolilacea TaxID=1033008 RepID=A0AAD6Z8A3_9AGAR|nr:hypothetical protein DFH08DRAFT_822351 [Mycena albidolilacea]